jgi:hypothetical protein
MILDLARRWTIAQIVRWPAARPFAAKRDLRMLARTTFGIVFAFAATLVAPGLLFVLGPIVLGVAHVASDVRYLVRRPASPTVLMYGGCAAILALRACEMARPDLLPYARLEIALAGAWIMAAACSVRRGFVVCAPVLALVAIAWGRADAARLVFAHVHNLVGVIVWLVVFRRRRALFTVPLALLALALGLLLSGATIPAVLAWRTFDVFGMNLYLVSDWLAPRVGDPLAQGVTLAYVFLQSIHYMVWLVWIPDEATRAEGTTTFRMTGRGLVRDFTPVGLAAILAAAAAVIVFAFVNVHGTRIAYLSLATFHGYLELAALAYLAPGGAVRRRAACTPPGGIASGSPATHGSRRLLRQ